MHACIYIGIGWVGLWCIRMDGDWDGNWGCVRMWCISMDRYLEYILGKV